MEPVNEALSQLVAIARAQRRELDAASTAPGAEWSYPELAARTAERCPDSLLRDALVAVLNATDWLETVTTGM